MVKIKGTEISNKIARDSIKAMERLIYLYRNPNNFLTCPLCRINRGCRKCPWGILKSRTCRGKTFSAILEDPKRTHNRIRQLRRWIKIYQKALKEKK